MLLEGLGLTGNAFIIMSPLKTPLNVLPNSSVPVVVRYLPNVAGQSNGNLLVTTTGDSLPIRNVPLTGYATPTDTVRFAALSPNLTVKPGDTALVLIKPSRGYKNKGISSIDITLEYNGDVMTPYLPGTETKSDIVGAIVSEQTEQPVGPRLRRLPLRVVGKNMTLDSATAIIYTKFVVTVSDTTSTQFRIAHFAINDSNPIFNKCVLGAISDSGTIGLEFVCGDSQLYRFLRDGNNFSPTDGIAPAIGAAHPNPITCASNASLSIPYRALRKVSARLEIIDARGATVYSTYHDSEAAGSAEFTLTPGLLKSGAYHYRILPTDGGRGVAMGEFVVLN
jgi:hypothetical protein